jgi:hypothetical protein
VLRFSVVDVHFQSAKGECRKDTLHRIDCHHELKTAEHLNCIVWPAERYSDM